MKNQLFLLHFAGGSSFSFDFLKKKLDQNISSIALELPGRGRRINEELIKSKEDAIADYCRQIVKLRNGNPFVIYGHSMGATLGLSVVSMLEKMGHFPERLIVSGNAGPGIKKKKDILRYLLDDHEFKNELRELGGIPEEVLKDDELYEFFAPIIRADFECLEKDNFSEKGIVINTPIYALMGTEEETCHEIENWKKFTDSDFKYRVLEGNHFFIYQHSENIAVILKKSFSASKKKLLGI
ncbi:alpha/beta fold hydrolase [Flavobacterium sp. KACC 22758]|jgi:surfactin synthase thioesterase subunit|uniref:thioesterase II family protein n=1 Tax=Flavobacterium sp. KACC 22758 TaxID=3025667 RepID=UPI002366931E|nr:alpha/beta fold hydrolase [Flavobacterium sp. KACC 22758]WDF58185.1 alpha/beta fold hydrolase [Flavobacterium sp. KACC 22758]